MNKCLLAALILAVPVPALADKLDDLKSQGFARVAIGNEPPFTAVGADGKVSGAAPDVARAVFQKLGVADLEASVSEYGAMIPSLQAGRVDAVTAGLFMKPERCNAVAYSEPILCDAEALLVPKGNPKGFKSYAGHRQLPATPRWARPAAGPRKSWRWTLACRATAWSLCRTRSRG